MSNTIIDIAKAANVSKATVDRVLNDRPNVGEVTRQRVLEAAANLQYSVKGVPIRAPGVITDTIDIILPAGTNEYLKNLQRELHEYARTQKGCELRVHMIEGFSAARLAAAIAKLSASSKAIALVGIDHPAVREAIRNAGRAGVKIVTLVSDIHDVPKLSYVGINNRAVGRLAGLLMGRLIKAQSERPIGLIAGSRLYSAHEEREAGFRSILNEQFPNLKALSPVEVHDDYSTAEEQTRLLLNEYENLAGIYSIGAGNRGVAEALITTGKTDEIVVIVHELTKFSKRYLLDGTFDVILDQNPLIEASQTIDLLLDRGVTRHPHKLVEPKVYFSENVA